MQRATLTTILLLLCASAAVFPGDGRTIEFPVIHSDIAECLNMQCARSINNCMDAHGEALTEKLKGCVVRKCKTITNNCMEQFFEQYLDQIEALYPQHSSVLLQNMDRIQAELTDSYLQCWLKTDKSRHSVCLMDSLTDKAQPFITSMTTLIFDDPAFVSCWLVQSLKGLVNCTDHLGDNYMQELKINAEKEMKLNMHRYLMCNSNPLKNWNSGCEELFDHVLASSPLRKCQYKDFLVCSIQSAILATAKC